MQCDAARREQCRDGGLFTSMQCRIHYEITSGLWIKVDIENAKFHHFSQQKSDKMSILDVSSKNHFECSLKHTREGKM